MTPEWPRPNLPRQGLPATLANPRPPKGASEALWPQIRLQERRPVPRRKVHPRLGSEKPLAQPWDWPLARPWRHPDPKPRRSPLRVGRGLGQKRHQARTSIGPAKSDLFGLTKIPIPCPRQKPIGASANDIRHGPTKVFPFGPAKASHRHGPTKRSSRSPKVSYLHSRKSDRAGASRRQREKRLPWSRQGLAQGHRKKRTPACAGIGAKAMLRTWVHPRAKFGPAKWFELVHPRTLRKGCESVSPRHEILGLTEW